VTPKIPAARVAAAVAEAVRAAEAAQAKRAAQAARTPARQSHAVAAPPARRYELQWPEQRMVVPWPNTKEDRVTLIWPGTF
jgi:predicted DNA-binding transcriptional regulator YafY